MSDLNGNWWLGDPRYNVDGSVAETSAQTQNRLISANGGVAGPNANTNNGSYGGLYGIGGGTQQSWRHTGVPQTLETRFGGGGAGLNLSPTTVQPQTTLSSLYQPQTYTNPVIPTQTDNSFSLGLPALYPRRRAEQSFNRGNKYFNMGSGNYQNRFA